jgi:hypothetical protein
MHNQLPNFGNLSYLANIWIIGKYQFNVDLAYKETQIDPFINTAMVELKQIGKYFKSLSFECLGNVCYFLQPLTYEFPNLRTLSFIMCTISLTQLNSILEKLTKLEALELNYLHLVKSSNSNFTENIAFPQSLRSLTYNHNTSSTTSLPLEKPLQFLSVNYIIHNRSAHPLLPIKLPNLHKLHYANTAVHEEFLEFLIINNHIEDLSIPITFIPTLKSNAELLSNLKILKLLNFKELSIKVTTESRNIPKLNNLMELSLDLRTSDELEFAGMLIKRCPKLHKLNIKSLRFELQKFSELIKYANNLKYFNEKRLY